MKYIIFLALFLTAITVNAQGKLSITGGLSLSNLKWSEGANEDSTRIGFYVGLSVKLPISSELSLLPELIYSQKGSTYHQDYSPFGTPILTKFNERFDFIEALIPLNFGITPSFSVQLGPQLSYLFNQVRTSKDYGKQGEGYTDIHPKFLVGGHAGLRVRLNEAIGIVSRYAMDLQKTTPFEGSPFTFKHNVFQIGLDYKLR